MQNSSITYNNKDALIDALRYELGRGSFKVALELLGTGVYSEGSKLIPLTFKGFDEGSPLPCVLEAAHTHIVSLVNKEDFLFKCTFLYSCTFLNKDVSGYILSTILQFEILEIAPVCEKIFDCLIEGNSLSILDTAISSGNIYIVNALLGYGFSAYDTSIYKFAEQSESRNLDLLLLLTSSRTDFNEWQYAHVCNSFKDESLIKEFFKKLEKNVSDKSKQKILRSISDEAIIEYSRDENIDIKNKYMVSIETCLNLGIDVNCMYRACSDYYDKCTLLHDAASRGLSEVVKLLLGVDNIQLNAKTTGEPQYYRPYSEYNALSLVLNTSTDRRAITPGQEDTFQLLLDAGCNTDLAVQYLNDHSDSEILNPYRELLEKHVQNNIWGDDIKQQAESSGKSLFK